ncbi:Lipid A core - O-antigen ligase-related enzyme [Polynucleobacter duraquae]|uniref:Lipid A core-O-antigen ligase-related enzyme n=1 Tax=Polynucleobacter duraquae TaxID=1835254 RepID=A0A0E3ZIQ7_9BURK|nr:O-antigen ligase family protein [Polynucleobacter duraquae]AKD24592.1 Lipid A core - O-antigen ligase-related enzyme [Polynucleobacter duraquae]
MLGYFFLNHLALIDRSIAGYHEVRNWINGVELDTSIGSRLSIWKFSLQFANESVLFGYGEEKNMLQFLQNSALNIPENKTAINILALAGPHSDILSKLLSTGIFGLVAYLGLLLLPLIIFYRHRNDIDLDKKMASRVGLYYIVGVFIAGFSNEQLSLKYLCTFYGLMIVTLMAQVLHKSSSAEQSKAQSGF